MPTTTVKQFAEIEAFKPGPFGYVRKVGRWRNLTLDSAIYDFCGAGAGFQSYTNAFYQFRLGTGTQPLKRAGGTITFSRTGNTVTASASFFEAADAGRVIVCTGTGELRISAYTNATTVTVSTAGADFAARSGTVYYVNRTGLASAGPLAAFSEVATNDTGDRHGYIFDAGTGKLTTWVTRVSGTAAADTLYTEIAWQNASGGTWGIALINGGVGDTLLAGERYRVKVITERTFTPVIETGAIALPVTGIDGVTCNWKLEGVEAPYFGADGSVVSVGDNFMDIGSTTRYCRLTDSTAAFRASVLGEVSFLGTTKATVALAAQTYVAGTTYRDYLATFAANTAAFSGVNSIQVGGNTSYNRCCLRGTLSAPIAKLLTEKLEFRFRLGIDRALTP